MGKCRPGLGQYRTNPSRDILQSDDVKEDEEMSAAKILYGPVAHAQGVECNMMTCGNKDVLAFFGVDMRGVISNQIA